jgi:hypothetical protein
MSYKKNPLFLMTVVTTLIVGVGFAKDSIEASNLPEQVRIDPKPVETLVIVPETTAPPEQSVYIDSSVNWLDQILDVVTAEYSWGASDETVALQELLSVTVDGNYGNETRAAHLSILAQLNLSSDNVPAPRSTTRAATPVSDKCTDWWSIARLAGWSESDLPKLGQIIFSESRCQPDVISRTNDYGLTQINWAAHGERLSAKGITRQDLLDPYTNLVEAKWISDYADRNYGCKWQPWYMSGSWC